MRRTIAPVLLAALALGLAGCAANLGASPSPSADPTVSPSGDPTRPVLSAPDLATVPPSDEPVTGEVPAEIMAEIVADAADRTGEAAEAIDVTQAVAITWNDGSLGCPEPNMSYTMALVDGYHVILVAGGEELDYRVGAGGGFRLCENGGRPSR
jgi:hypothetical protein